MVEYVLGGSPTNKDSPLALDGRLRNLKIDEVKVNISSTFLCFLCLTMNAILSRAMTIRRTIRHHLRLME